MPRFSNVGGMLGFGPVDPHDSYKPFEWVWEARVWALNSLLSSKFHYSTDEKRDLGEQVSADDYLGMSYYERWLSRIETLLSESGVLDPAELDAMVEDAERDSDKGHQHWHSDSESGREWETPYA